MIVDAWPAALPVGTVAMAAVRATREARVAAGGKDLEAIVGVPLAGETLDGQTFDGRQEAAIFPGELPADPRAVFRGEGLGVAEHEADYRFLRFRPPLARMAEDGQPYPLQHIRLDRALEFLLGDRLS